MKKLIPLIAITVVIFMCACLFGKRAVIHFFDDGAPQPQVHSVSNDVQLKKGDFVFFGKYGGEDILWQVTDVSNGKPLLTSYYVICQKPFDAGDEKYKFGSSNWESSSLKKWLNSSDTNVSYDNPPDNGSVSGGWNSYDSEPGFLNEDNFTKIQKNMISGQGVFILSKKEVSTYFNAAQRRKGLSESAAVRDESPYIVTSGMSVWYWTRTPVSSNKMCVTAVTTSGGFYKSPAYDSTAGVVPSLYLNSFDVEASGNGEFENPYYLR